MDSFETKIEPLFAEDQGQLSLEARRVLTQLLRGPFIDAKIHVKLWPTLLSHEIIIRSRLHELFLELIIDYDQQVAFTRQAETGELVAPILLRQTALTFIDSVLLLYLRQLLGESEVQGERAVVSVAEIYEQLTLYQKTQQTDEVGFKKRMQTAIENTKKYNILTRLTDDRYEISPILKLLFSAEQVIALKQQYQQILASQSTGVENDATN